MILIPSRGRPQWLANFLRTALAHGMTENGVVMIDADDATAYSNVPLPDGWIFEIRPRATIASRWNDALKVRPDEPHYALMTDDAEPMTQGWDARLREELKTKKVVWPDDLYEQRSTFPWVRGELARGFGFLAAPGLKHLYIDTFWGDVVDGQGLVADVKVKHHLKIDDETHRQRQDGNDSGVYTTLKNERMRDFRLHV